MQITSDQQFQTSNLFYILQAFFNKEKERQNLYKGWKKAIKAAQAFK